MPRTKEAFEAMREITRQKIEAAALPLFARKGLSVSVAEIARAAGVSKGLLYSHYPSKEALIAELARQASVISAGIISDIAASSGTAAVKIKQINALMCEMLAANDHYGIENFMFMAQVGISGLPRREDMYNEERPNPAETLARIISAGQSEGSVAAGDPLMLATVYWAAIQGLCGYVMAGMTLKFYPEMLLRLLLEPVTIKGESFYE